MGDDEPTFDEADLAFMHTLIPEDATPIGMFCVVQFFDADGQQRWKRYSPFDAPVSSAAGVALLGILAMIADCDTGIEWREPI